MLIVGDDLVGIATELEIFRRTGLVAQVVNDARVSFQGLGLCGR